MVDTALGGGDTAVNKDMIPNKAYRNPAKKYRNK